MEAVQEALARHGRSEIFSKDQEVAFTLTDVIEVPTARGIRIGADGRGARRDNAFVQRRWRTVEYPMVCLRTCTRVREARAWIRQYPGFYTS